MSGKSNKSKSFAQEGLDALEANGLSEIKDNSSSEDWGNLQEVGSSASNEDFAFYYKYRTPKRPPTGPWKLMEKGEIVRGIYLRDVVGGKYENHTYYVKREDGKVVGLPGCGQLDKKMSKLEPGPDSKIVIIFGGSAEITNGDWAGNDAYLFQVFGNKVKQ